ncbi:MAG: proline dehydrogenase family protein [Limnobacter sp.]|uniref:proline dehydrogenase family protein n=1 Tax=Limnobacter sp. TaxID=2003368 RepID=UPI00391C52A2
MRRDPALALIQAGTSVGTTSPGTEEAPAVLAATLAESLRQQHWAVHCPLPLSGPANPNTPVLGGYRNLQETAAWVQQVYGAVETSLAQGHLPVMLGGDHALSIGSIAAVAAHCRAVNRPLRVVWVDAHADFNTADTSPTGNLHGMPLACLCGQGPPELLAVMGHRAALKPDQVCYLGLREMDPLESLAVEASGLHRVSTADLANLGVDEAMTRVLAHIPPNAHLHISFDVDSLNPEEAPGVGTPVQGGPGVDTMAQCLLRLAQTGQVASMDVVEYNPRRDEAGRTAKAVQQLVRLALSNRAGLQAARHRPQAEHEQQLAETVSRLNLDESRIHADAAQWVTAMRQRQPARLGVHRLMHEYGLSTPEGMALMCLAEALLRVPDNATRDALIHDALGKPDWSSHLGHSDSLFVNATTWGLLIAGKWVSALNHTEGWRALTAALARGGEPLLRAAVTQAVGVLGQQFVMADTIEQGMHKADSAGVLCSFDMLGEAALAPADADRYEAAYRHAIDCVGNTQAHSMSPKHSVSIKLSALYWHYDTLHAAEVHRHLYPRLLRLVQQAHSHGVMVNLDAEECHRLELSLALFERLAYEPSLRAYQGLGFVVQAYQTRAHAVLESLAQLAQNTGHRFPVRLVKGAYWDTEVKLAQQAGLAQCPVFIGKHLTDLNYLVCADQLLARPDVFFPQLATHNAWSVAAVLHLARRHGVSDFEMQALHGMGEALYSHVPVPCRTYAPIGPAVDLLPYLVRRLLENGANTSFVHRLADPSTPLDEVLQSPLSALRAASASRAKAHSLQASELYTGHPSMARNNSPGLDILDPAELHHLLALGVPRPVLGERPEWANPAHIGQALNAARAQHHTWAASSLQQRSALFKALAHAMVQDRDSALVCLVHEARKTWRSAVAEWREAIDFCEHNATQVLTLQPTKPPAGVALCISPWNFPVAILVGQMVTALASGRPVLLKPAEQTPHCAQWVLRCMHAACKAVGLSQSLVQVLHGDGDVGAQLVQAPGVGLVMFTGSCEVARHIQNTLLNTSGDGPPALLVAETGGQNVMLADATAHVDQLVRDVMESAFDSAGQRCSATRVLCVQDDIADTVLQRLKAVMATWVIGPAHQPNTDVGPMIDQQAWMAVEHYVGQCLDRGLPVHRTHWPDHGQGQSDWFCPPTVVELNDWEDLGDEVFGPVLHILRYGAHELEATLERINALGYGLTAGLHSRIESVHQSFADRLRVGNLYINRNTIGAVVGSQPFGGRGLSGTGPKAGGRWLLPWVSACPLPAAEPLLLPGPVGERNTLNHKPRGLVWCAGPSPSDVRAQTEQALATGNQVWAGPNPPLSRVDAVLVAGDAATLQLVHRAVFDNQPALVPVCGPGPDGRYPLHALLWEQVLSVNTAAMGGNPELLGMAQ